MKSPTAAITFHDVTLERPDGTRTLEHLDATLTTGRTGLIGRNGSGKSTLLELVAGNLRPTSGWIDTTGDVGYLAQNAASTRGTTVAGLLGVERKLAALRAIESGDVAEENFEVVGDDWDLEARAAEALQRAGLRLLDLDRRVEELSGGESTLLAVSGLRLQRKQITLLDEPTNNLDRPTRAALTEMIDTWPGTLVVVSHDLELLEHVDTTAELHDSRLRLFGGPYGAWRAHLESEQAAATQAARSAQQALHVEKRQRIEAETRLARRARTAKKTQKDGGIPKILAGNRANRAQNSAGTLRSTLDDKVSAAQSAVDAADARVREQQHLRIVLPDPDVPRARRLAELSDAVRTVVVQGPERVALVGPNGVGKSTLLQRLLTGAEPGDDVPHGRLLTDRVGYLPQRFDTLDTDRSALENVGDVAADVATAHVRNQLAALLLRGDVVDRPVSTLSGGERFRVNLARLLLADPPSQLLVLDEPTNDLDVDSVEQLAEALDAYRGGLLVVSHDHRFLERIGITTRIALSGDGRLHPVQ